MHGIAVAILSVRPSVRRMYCDKTKWQTADILIPHETAITLVFWHQHWLVCNAPFPLKFVLKVSHPLQKHRLRQISAYKVSTVRDCEKSSIMTSRKSTTSFPTSYRLNAYVTRKSPKGWLKKRFFRFFLNKSQLRLNKVCYKVSLWENFQQLSCSTAIPVSNSP